MVHVADAVGTAIVGLYSGDNQNVERYRPSWVKHRILQSNTLSIQQIEPSEVISAVKELTNDYRPIRQSPSLLFTQFHSNYKRNASARSI